MDKFDLYYEALDSERRFKRGVSTSTKGKKNRDSKKGWSDKTEQGTKKRMGHRQRFKKAVREREVAVRHSKGKQHQRKGGFQNRKG